MELHIVLYGYVLEAVMRFGGTLVLKSKHLQNQGQAIGKATDYTTDPGGSYSDIDKSFTIWRAQSNVEISFFL